MCLNNVLKINQQLLVNRIPKYSIAIDATAGNGNDGLFVLTHANSPFTLHCCDIQEVALTNTKEKIGNYANKFNVFFHHKNHLDLFRECDSEIDLILFNLGYLPGGNHHIRTSTDNTIQTLKFAEKIVRPGGVISIVAYSGTEEGRAESIAVKNWSSSLSQKIWNVLQVEMINQVNFPPCLFFIEKR